MPKIILVLDVTEIRLAQQQRREKGYIPPIHVTAVSDIDLVRQLQQKGRDIVMDLGSWMISDRLASLIPSDAAAAGDLIFTPSAEAELRELTPDDMPGPEQRALALSLAAIGRSCLAPADVHAPVQDMSADPDLATAFPSEPTYIVSYLRHDWAAGQAGQPYSKVTTVIEDQVEMPLAHILAFAMMGRIDCAAAPTADSENGNVFLSTLDPRQSGFTGAVATGEMTLHRDGKLLRDDDQLYAIAEFLDIHYAGGHDLEMRRSAAAQRIYSTADFGGLSVEARDGWDISGDYWSTTVYLDAGGEASTAMAFGLNFEKDSAILLGDAEFELPEPPETCSDPEVC